MKNLIIIWLTLSFLSAYTQEYSLRTRIWTNKGQDDGSIHPIGNGGMLVYGQGPNIHRVFGAPYSAPNYLQMNIEETSRDIKVESRREKNTAIWHHHVFSNNKPIADFSDYILPDKNVFIRDVETAEEIIFKISVPEKVESYITSGYFRYVNNQNIASAILRSPMGSKFFVNQPIPEEVCMIIGASGFVNFSELQGREFYINIKPGKSRIIFCNSKTYPENISNLEFVLRNSDADYIKQSRKYWHGFSSRRFDFASKIPDSNTLKDSILDAIDGVSILIKAQQSNSGGVMAGHIYNMAYVRDMSGVMRGLLALGYIPETKAILDFWIHKYYLLKNYLRLQ